MTFRHNPATHAGELDPETLDELWDHLDDETGGERIPTFSSPLLSFFHHINGIQPTNAYVNGIRITRFLNFCNDYDSKNVEIAEWQIVRNRRWIADRLHPMTLPIAELAHGDYLCLDFQGGDNPKVVRWLHEKSKPGLPAFEPLADDLDSFLGMVEEPEPRHRTRS